MKRTQLILAILLTVQIILSAVVFWPRPTTAGGAALFPDLNVADITALTLENSSGTLTLRSVDGAWVLPDAGNYPALADTIMPVLEKLTQLNTAQLVARTAVAHQQLQVAADDYALKLTFETAAGAQTLYLGTSAGAGATHVRVDGQADVYLAQNLNIWDLSPDAAAWIDTGYVNVPANSITQVTVQNAQGEVTLVRDEQALWRLPGADLNQIPDQSKISEMLTRLAALTITAPLGTQTVPEYGLEHPTAVITLTTPDNTITLTVGAKDEQGYVVSSSESPYYVRVMEYLLQPWVEATPESFAQTPTPAAAP